MENENLLAELEDLLRNIPDRSTIREDREENHSWFGRVSAVIEAWSRAKGATMSTHIGTFHVGNSFAANKTLPRIMTLMHQCRSDLRMKTIGPASIAIGGGMVFDYFDELRKVIETAQGNLFFIDPYLDAEFVPRYLSHVKRGVAVRLLTSSRKLQTLVPAIDTFVKQTPMNIIIRSTNNIHDRYLIADGNVCYQSGASFKDGAKKSPTTLTQITDAFPAVQSTYEDMWDKAKVIFP